MERDARKLAMLMAESIASELRAFAFSKSLVDEKIVDEIVKESGVAGMLAKWSDGEIVVYYIKVGVLEKECAYSECSKLPSGERRECVNRCIEKSAAKAARLVAKSIAEYASYLSSRSK